MQKLNVLQVNSFILIFSADSGMDNENISFVSEFFTLDSL
jgi:hypothetical protein